ncbi:hypothetical protein HDU87_008721 [Geranomyces variabilis]|uniref:Uncharacterized protein n=1 Tax=Geranomyces variabilis TaxID=109894 RepID=A0AAD5XM03_9FUNG|nr:hypothetical protein HDU87_008721 [Geranomyces variabilis]
MTAVTSALQRNLFVDDQGPFRFGSHMHFASSPPSEAQVLTSVSAAQVPATASVDEMGLLELETDTDLTVEAAATSSPSNAVVVPPVSDLITAEFAPPGESAHVILLDGAAGYLSDLESVDGHESAEDLIEFEEISASNGPALKLEIETAAPATILQPEQPAGEEPNSKSLSVETEESPELSIFADADLIEYQEEEGDMEGEAVSESPIVREIDDELESPIGDEIDYLPLPCVLLSYRGTTHAVFNIYQGDLDLQPIFDEEHDGAVLFESPLTEFVSEVKAYFEIHTDVSLDFPQLDLNLNENLACMQTLSFNRVHEYLSSASMQGEATTLESEPLRVTLREENGSLTKRLEELETLAIDAGFVPLDEHSSESGSDGEMTDLHTSPINGHFFESDLQMQNDARQSPSTPINGISPLLGHEVDRIQAAEHASSSKRAGKLTKIRAVPDFSPRPPSRDDFAASDDDNLGAKRARKSVAFAGSLKNLAGPPTFEPPAALKTRTPSAQSLRPIFKSVTLNDVATGLIQKPPEPVVPAGFGQRAKSSQNLSAMPFAPSALAAQPSPLLTPTEAAYTTTASAGSLARGRRISSSVESGIPSALSGQEPAFTAPANPGSLARGMRLGSSGATGMPNASSSLVKPMSVGADSRSLQRSVSTAGSSDVLRIASTNLRVLTGAKSPQLEAAVSQLDDAAAGDAADREKRPSADQGVFLPILAPANANRVLPSASGRRAGQWVPSESNDGEEAQDFDDARDQDNGGEPPSNRAISGRSRSFVLSPSPPKEPRPRGNSLKWASDGGARKMNKPIWKPGGMDETAKAEFVKNKERARAVISAIGRRKPRTASDKENDEQEPDEAQTEPVLPLEPQPPLALIPHPPQKYKFDRKNVKFTIETPGSRPGSGLLDLEGRSLPPLPITSILMYDPPPIRSALRLSRPPKTRIRADGTVEVPDDEKAAEPEPNMAHSLRADFIRDFTLLSSHDTTQQDIEMQAMLRDVDAIGVSRAGWSSKAEMYNISPEEVRRMCKVFYTYLKSERLVQRGGLFGNDLGGKVVQVIGSSGSSAMVSFLKEKMAGLDRGRYLYAKAMVGHISRLSAMPLEICLLPHLAAALAPLLLPHHLVRPEKEQITPLIHVHDDRPIPGFRSRPPSPPLQSPAIFPFSFFPPVPAVTAAAALLADEAEQERRASEDVAFGSVGAVSEGDDAAVVPFIMPLGPAATALMVMAENFDAIFGGARGNG